MRRIGHFAGIQCLPLPEVAECNPIIRAGHKKITVLRHRLRDKRTHTRHAYAHADLVQRDRAIPGNAKRAVAVPGHHMFDNVFVEPGAYKSFVATGKWPDKTVLVLEVRGAKDKGSINKHGNYQDSEVMGREVHVKDTSRFPENGWAFFGFDSGTSAKMTPRTADCYSCHADHAAVDNTFVQFYPTLLPIATEKGTLSAAYKAESAKN